jgi:hypothetical protein
LNIPAGKEHSDDNAFLRVLRAKDFKVDDALDLYRRQMVSKHIIKACSTFAWNNHFDWT